jgi:hypothetical protein
MPGKNSDHLDKPVRATLLSCSHHPGINAGTDRLHHTANDTADY